MEAADIIAAFRQRADDATAPYLYTDEDALRWASEAEREACIRANLIFDRSKPSVCFVPVLPGITSYALNPLIVDVAAVYLDRAAQYPGMNRLALDRADQSNQRARFRRGRDYGNDLGYRDDFGLGTHVRMYSIDGQTLQLYGTPDTTFAAMPSLSYLRLEVYRLPLEAMESPSDEPEIPVVHQDGLVDWMLYRAFSGKDGEELDDRRAVQALTLFTQRFGDRPSANQMRMQAEGRRWTTQYGGL